MDVHNASFASPLADAKYAQFVGHPQIDSVLSSLFDLSGWTIVLTLFLVAVAYDQCKYICRYTNM
jgi:C-22 sterol desaturase